MITLELRGDFSEWNTLSSRLVYIVGFPLKMSKTRTQDSADVTEIEEFEISTDTTVKEDAPIVDNLETMMSGMTAVERMKLKLLFKIKNLSIEDAFAIGCQVDPVIPLIKLEEDTYFKMWKCSLCDLKYKHFGSYSAHMQREHRETETASTKDVKKRTSEGHKTSYVWQHFTVISGNLAECSLCRQHVKRGCKTVKYLKRHLKKFHKILGDKKPKVGVKATATKNKPKKDLDFDCNVLKTEIPKLKGFSGLDNIGRGKRNRKPTKFDDSFLEEDNSQEESKDVFSVIDLCDPRKDASSDDEVSGDTTHVEEEVTESLSRKRGVHAKVKPEKGNRNYMSWEAKDGTFIYWNYFTKIEWKAGNRDYLSNLKAKLFEDTSDNFEGVIPVSEVNQDIQSASQDMSETTAASTSILETSTDNTSRLPAESSETLVNEDDAAVVVSPKPQTQESSIFRIVECNLCHTRLVRKTRNDVTSGMVRHLKTVHGMTGRYSEPSKTNRNYHSIQEKTRGVPRSSYVWKWYQDIEGDQDFLTCNVCFSCVRNVKGTIRSHLQKHGIFKEGDQPQDKKTYKVGGLAFADSCRKCGKEFDDDNLIVRHMKYDHFLRENPDKVQSRQRMRNKLLECDFEGCGKKYALPFLLAIHRREKHNGIETFIEGEKIEAVKPFFNPNDIVVCDKCGKELRRCKLRDHILVRHEPENKPFPCDQCSRGFTKGSLLLNHRRRRHCPKDMTNLVMCEICSKTYFDENSLRNHQRFKHEVISIGCRVKECPQVFKNIGARNQHYHSVHVKTMKHICEFCGWRFWEEAELVWHVKRLHEDGVVLEDAILINEQRDWSLIKKSTEGSVRRLGVRVPRHLMGFRFKCKFEGCKEKFKSFAARTEHSILVHDVQMPHQCPFCGMKFWQLRNKNQHTNSKHKEGIRDEELFQENDKKDWRFSIHKRKEMNPQDFIQKVIKEDDGHVEKSRTLKKTSITVSQTTCSRSKSKTIRSRKSKSRQEGDNFVVLTLQEDSVYTPNGDCIDFSSIHDPQSCTNITIVSDNSEEYQAMHHLEMPVSSSHHYNTRHGPRFSTNSQQSVQDIPSFSGSSCVQSINYHQRSMLNQLQTSTAVLTSYHLQALEPPVSGKCKLCFVICHDLKKHYLQEHKVAPEAAKALMSDQR